MPDRNDEIAPGVTWGAWIGRISEIRRNPEENGISTKLGIPVCQGGYCKRHGRTANVKYQTETGLQLCEQCAIIWSNRRFFDMPRELKDL